MSLLSEYRNRIKNLLAADDVQQALLLEGVVPDVARAVGISKAVVAQRSLIRRNSTVKEHIGYKTVPSITEEDKRD